MVKFITIRGTRALRATPYYIGIPQHERIMSRREAYELAAERTGYKATAIRLPLPPPPLRANGRLRVRKRTTL